MRPGKVWAGAVAKLCGGVSSYWTVGSLPVSIKDGEHVTCSDLGDGGLDVTDISPGLQGCSYLVIK